MDIFPDQKAISNVQRPISNHEVIAPLGQPLVWRVGFSDRLGAALSQVLKRKMRFFGDGNQVLWRVSLPVWALYIRDHQGAVEASGAT